MNKNVGDMLTVNLGILVHQVNAQGVMASGVAKAIRKRYPQVFIDYSCRLGPPYCQKECGAEFLGDVIWTHVNTGLMVASVVGQQFYGKEKKRYTSYDALDVGLEKVGEMAKVKNLPVHYPLIGCGLGGGDWGIVSAILEKNLAGIEHTLWELPQ